jgi:hypothetical protein
MPFGGVALDFRPSTKFHSWSLISKECWSSPWNADNHHLFFLPGPQKLEKEVADDSISTAGAKLAGRKWMVRAQNRIILGILQIPVERQTVGGHEAAEQHGRYNVATEQYGSVDTLGRPSETRLQKMDSPMIQARHKHG